MSDIARVSATTSLSSIYRTLYYGEVDECDRGHATSSVSPVPRCYTFYSISGLSLRLVSGVRAQQHFASLFATAEDARHIPGLSMLLLNKHRRSISSRPDISGYNSRLNNACTTHPGQTCRLPLAKKRGGRGLAILSPWDVICCSDEGDRVMQE